MTSSDKVRVYFMPHKDDAVIISVEDPAELHDDANTEARSTWSFPYRWSEVKARMIADNIFSTIDGDAMELELRAKCPTRHDTAASLSEVKTVISKLPRAS
jgi:hypothetical protein